ncbi:SDR family NAD(P)-dependent oxidoreductase [Oceanivirga miroungae]|uniref:Short-chain dehydrogenase/reductase SDR n=1 Tax=Oceanivirga miroungae TaxID=1130046 RepID=A0A6I8MDZ6_9FUSO|nr:SDR family NAD(P)-dependent oxidoreductase [Oceanivirga miroungae]VWL85777.1 short-chain dehydrogenase/reductase SDR [Oceanivirga miroungae]
MKNISIITGATSGIGLEISKIIAKKDTDLLIISSNEENLIKTKETLEKITKNKVFYMPINLINLKEEDIKKIEEYISSYNLLYFINNAGFGDFGKFLETSQIKQDNMIKLNIQALTNLTRLYLKIATKQKEKSYLLNVASTAAYTSGPQMAVYYATKAYVLSFTRAIRYEYKNSKNINISVLSPGPTETNFIKSSSLEASSLFNNLKSMSAQKVAEIAMKNLDKNKAEIIPGIMNKIMVILTKFSPKAMTIAVVSKIMEKK